MLVNPSVPAETVPEFVAYAKANPGKINFGSNGVGATGHLAGEMFKVLTGVDMLHVPYRGEAPALTDLISGRLQLMFASMTSSLPMIKGGRLRALAVTTLDRAEALPNLPPLAEFVPKCQRPNKSIACTVKQPLAAPLSAKGFFRHCQTSPRREKKRRLNCAHGRAAELGSEARQSNFGVATRLCL